MKVEWADFEADHKKSHNKGRLTIIPNSQVTHKACKGNKYNLCVECAEGGAEILMHFFE